MKVDLRIEAPLLLAGIRVESDDAIEWVLKYIVPSATMGVVSNSLFRRLSVPSETSPVWYSQATFSSATLLLSIRVSGE